MPEAAQGFMMNPDEEIRNKYIISVTLDRFEASYAVIKTDDGQEILWPAQKLPADVKEGDVLKLRLGTSATETAEREKLAKQILEEILKRGK